MKINFARYIRLIKQGITDYRWILFYIQRISYNPNHRRFVTRFLSYFLPKSSILKTTTEIQKMIQVLQKDGLFILDNFVTESEIKEMRAYLATKFCFDPKYPGEEGFNSPEYVPKSCLHCYYKPEDIVDVPHLLDLVNNWKILTTIECLFGAKPTISLIQIWWLLQGFDFKANLEKRDITNPDEFHRDIDDWSEIKLFIYLTDVDEDSAPHAYIKKSHKWLLPFRERFLDINNTNFPVADNLIKLTGKAGLAWLENTYVLHRSLIPTKNHRLIIAVTYSLFPLPYAPKKPLLYCLDKNKFDSYINRIYLN
ncbi:hypothetical protein ACE1AT_28835 [Pelatocladus sp. BLCC-F211]|uniref:hypothetical protein n=1 Tax=Pelatocladus sp. BLCC-F211 TaxID=3342752 RepID=UPI0035B8F1E8